MIDIKVPQKYRWEGKWPKSQKADGTPNGGDAYLLKSRTKRKLPPGKPATLAQQAASAAGMRYLVITPSGKRQWIKS